jgi:hypothetical protein
MHAMSVAVQSDWLPTTCVRQTSLRYMISYDDSIFSSCGIMVLTAHTGRSAIESVWARAGQGASPRNSQARKSCISRRSRDKHWRASVHDREGTSR